MSHETTHVATGATFASMPTWLLEGFADFVALDHAGVPVDLAAGQILPRIRKEGLPDGCRPAGPRPDRQRAGRDLRGGLAGLPLPRPGVRRRALVRFYRTVNDGPRPSRRSAACWAPPRGVRGAWRADLARLAGVAG